MRENLEWCVSNAISEDHSENIGRCIYHSTKLDCQEEVQVRPLLTNHKQMKNNQLHFFQNKKLTSFKLKHSALNKKLEKLSKNREFTNAVVVYPIMQATEFYLLNAFYARVGNCFNSWKDSVQIDLFVAKIGKIKSWKWRPVCGFERLLASGTPNRQQATNKIWPTTDVVFQHFTYVFFWWLH